MDISRELQRFEEPKLEELQHYKRLYQKNRNEWEKFIAGRSDIDTSIVPEDVLAGWIRCRDYGFDPLTPPQKKVLKGKALAELLEKNKRFIDVSRPFLIHLYQFLQDSGFNVVLFDREGYLIEILGDHDKTEKILNAGGLVGALWSEQSAGHNAAGSIVATKKPIQIFGSQHYIRDYHVEIGCGAPIFSPEGEFIGGISLNARTFRFNRHTLGMAVAVAYAIENELQSMHAFSESQKAYRFQQSVIASVTEAMIAIDNPGTISLINDPARKLLSSRHKQLEGKSLREVLADKNPDLLKKIITQDQTIDEEVRLFSNNTWNDYTLTINPIISEQNRHIGKVIVLNEIKRAKSMFTKMLGAHAAYHFEDICGRNSRFLVSIEQARMVARNNSNVLLLGKSGTGKDILAQSIHNASSRWDAPYVAINCGAIPRDLIASELFGHEEGAFTGSRRGGSQGKFELADGGTIFLDEIAEMPLELQTALLRVIEDKSLTRLGGKQTRKVDVRVITATNKNLREEIEKGNFREDLYYRINVFCIELLPLRERRDDIRLLTDFFVRKYNGILDKQIDFVPETIINAFENYSWPGNIRELQNVIERMMNFAGANELTDDLLPVEILNGGTLPAHVDDLVSPEESEKKLITKMLDLKFDKTSIAKKLNMSRATLYRRCAKYGIGKKRPF